MEVAVFVIAAAVLMLSWLSVSKREDERGKRYIREMFRDADFSEVV
jgi:hypothetical protein